VCLHVACACPTRSRPGQAAEVDMAESKGQRSSPLVTDPSRSGARLGRGGRRRGGGAAGTIRRTPRGGSLRLVSVAPPARTPCPLPAAHEDSTVCLRFNFTDASPSRYDAPGPRSAELSPSFRPVSSRGGSPDGKLQARARAGHRRRRTHRERRSAVRRRVRRGAPRSGRRCRGRAQRPAAPHYSAALRRASLLGSARPGGTAAAAADKTRCLRRHRCSLAG
jgi:hypothetical protein